MPWLDSEVRCLVDVFDFLNTFNSVWGWGKGGGVLEGGRGSVLIENRGGGVRRGGMGGGGNGTRGMSLWLIFLKSFRGRDSS